MKLFKVLIKSYHFGIVHYDLFVLAEDEEAMYQTVYNHPLYKKDEDAEIETWEEVDLSRKVNRVL